MQDSRHNGRVRANDTLETSTSACVPFLVSFVALATGFVVVTGHILLTCSLPEASVSASAPATLVLILALENAKLEAAERTDSRHRYST
jgi:hypothetical protein